MTIRNLEFQGSNRNDQCDMYVVSYVDSYSFLASIERLGKDKEFKSNHFHTRLIHSWGGGPPDVVSGQRVDRHIGYRLLTIITVGGGMVGMSNHTWPASICFLVTSCIIFVIISSRGQISVDHLRWRKFRVSRYTRIARIISFRHLLLRMSKRRVMRWYLVSRDIGRGE